MIAILRRFLPPFKIHPRDMREVRGTSMAAQIEEVLQKFRESPSGSMLIGPVRFHDVVFVKQSELDRVKPHPIYGPITGDNIVERLLDAERCRDAFMQRAHAAERKPMP